MIFLRFTRRQARAVLQVDLMMVLRMKAHNLTIDYIRAVLIILVILVHIVNFGELYPDVKSSILAFFMPAFLIITGYLVNVNKPLRSFALYILRILLPYVIMVTGFMVLSLYLPVRDGVDELTPATVYRVLCITSIGPYWFLRVMMVCGVLYYAAFSALKGKSKITQCVAFATLLILVSEFTPFLGLKPAAYYFTGVLLRVFLKDISKILKGNFWAVIPFLLLLTNKSFQDWGGLSIFACCFCFFLFTTWLSGFFRGGFASLMGYLGRNTLPIYIFHPIFTMMSKYMLPLFSFDNTGLLHTLTTIVMCVAGSLAVAYAMDRTRLSYVFAKKQILR